ncbi:hypothetical protein [Streptomyces sp. NPDC059008]|uniref:hypothetical protein n=1 Tax=Streptomyces sp. NPDC059008 TaxID=3346693 RepID=UPI0036856D3C
MSYVYSVDKGSQRSGEREVQYRVRLRTVSIKKLNLTRMKEQKNMEVADKKPEIRTLSFKGTGSAIAALEAVEFGNAEYACLLDVPKGMLSLLRLSPECLQQDECPGSCCRHHPNDPCYEVSEIDSGLSHPCVLAYNEQRQMIAVIGLHSTNVAFISTVGAVGSFSPQVYDLGYQPDHVRFSPDGVLCAAAAARDRKLVLLLMSEGNFSPQRLVIDVSFPDCGGPHWLAITQTVTETECQSSAPEMRQYIVTGICPKGETMEQGVIAQAVVTQRLFRERNVKIAKVGSIKAKLSAFIPTAATAYNIELHQREVGQFHG